MSTLCRHWNYDVEVSRLGTRLNKNCKVKKDLHRHKMSTSMYDVDIMSTSHTKCQHYVDIVITMSKLLDLILVLILM